MLDQIKSAAKAVAGLAGDAVAAGAEKLRGPMEELSAAAGDLEQLGYRVGQIELACALPPRVVVYLARRGGATAEAYQAVTAKYADSQTVKAVVGLLQMCDRLVERVKLQGRRCTHVAVELGVPPSVRLIYDREPGEGGTMDAGVMPGIMGG